MTSEVYFIGSRLGIKIGHTGGAVSERLQKLQTGHPARLEILAVMEGDREVETSIHELLAPSRIYGEFFEVVAVWTFVEWLFQQHKDTLTDQQKVELANLKSRLEEWMDTTDGNEAA